jgi:hypothetical protein
LRRHQDVRRLLRAQFAAAVSRNLLRAVDNKFSRSSASGAPVARHLLESPGEHRSISIAGNSAERTKLPVVSQALAREPAFRGERDKPAFSMMTCALARKGARVIPAILRMRGLAAIASEVAWRRRSERTYLELGRPADSEPEAWESSKEWNALSCRIWSRTPFVYSH